MKDRGHSTETWPAPAADLRRPVIRSAEEADALRARVLGNANLTAARLRDFAGSPLELLTALHFQKEGHDPITGKPLNIMEQVNQTCTILVSLRAVVQLLAMHPDANGFELALATSSGRDIKSVKPDLVAAEAFSATHPGSNQKLKKDLDCLQSDPARYRYVFFAAPACESGLFRETEPGIKVYCVEI